MRDVLVKDRRDILQALIPTGGRIQFSEAMPGTGDAFITLSTELAWKHDAASGLFA
ncbi:hypothetical protein LB557_05515 [Mesorhizobium sp. BR115XR7A]|uniref:hypothetical protein n=1 Tax=Mesorhizobium sp. BR115XR7A TaxID=2876645 RepID=UPI001CCFB13C|nr:hypothetical protein [Mesorhizobium sp. BR115XR7A]MBZ9905461.1 hypothetical protein [Mesorhizobium sp. BR115XR7A]MBZ9929589.1 hypothetical protein [Mesorhizobium sp. BR1-1-5]